MRSYDVDQFGQIELIRVHPKLFKIAGQGPSLHRPLKERAGCRMFRLSRRSEALKAAVFFQSSAVFTYSNPIYIQLKHRMSCTHIIQNTTYDLHALWRVHVSSMFFCQLFTESGASSSRMVFRVARDWNAIFTSTHLSCRPSVVACRRSHPGRHRVLKVSKCLWSLALRKQPGG